MLTIEQLLHIMPHANQRAKTFLLPLEGAMEKFGIELTLDRQCYFLAQVAEESGELRYVRELGNGKQYEGRKDLGNTHPGDGPRFKGRGLLQITGRDNYTHCGIALGVDLVEHPELLELPQYAAGSAGWFWQSRLLNEESDAGDFLKVTKRINGGTNGLDRRLLYLTLAKEAFNNGP